MNQENHKKNINKPHHNSQHDKFHIKTSKHFQTDSQTQQKFNFPPLHAHFPLHPQAEKTEKSAKSQQNKSLLSSRYRISDDENSSY